MAIPAFKYQQSKQDYISFVIPFEKLNKMSKVLIYQEHEDGYQRKPNQLHISRIKKFVLGDIENFKLPTSIILGVDQNDIEPHLTPVNAILHDLNVEQINTAMFRIVDGQHRLRGLEKALESLDGDQRRFITDYQFNVVCILTEENNRSVELDIFTDINSKGKKVSTDLAELARYNYQIKERKVEKEIPNISEHIAIKCARELRENVPDSVWHYAIKFDIHSEVNLGIIGVSAFRKSITGIIQKYITQTASNLLELDGKDLIEACDQKAIEVKDFIGRCWDEVVFKKWTNCFENSKVEDDFGDIVAVKFSKKYYIQKPLGVKSINRIIEEVVDETATLEDAFRLFNQRISDSDVKNEHWKTGGTFSGLNSEGGFKKIREMIKNERSIPTS